MQILINFVVYALATIGLTKIIVDSSIFSPIRDFVRKYGHPKLYKLVTCYQCAGTWVGAFCGALVLSLKINWILAAAFAGSYLAILGHMVVTYIEFRTVYDGLEVDDGDPVKE